MQHDALTGLNVSDVTMSVILLMEGDAKETCPSWIDQVLFYSNENIEQYFVFTVILLPCTCVLQSELLILIMTPS